MKYFKTKGHVGPDGKVFIIAPAEFANEDVLVVLERSRHQPTTPLDWKEFVRQTAGSIPDFPDVERPGPESFTPREPLD